VRDYPTPDTSPEAIALTFKRYAAQVAVSEDFFFGGAELSVQQEMVFNHLVFQLRAKILTDDLPPEEFTARDHVTFEVPTSTWQMWKKRHARRWYARRLVARWPVRYEPDPDGRGADAVCTFDLARWRAYPRARVPLPQSQFGDPVLFHSTRDIRWSHNPTATED
jgi:hypothetical protein